MSKQEKQTKANQKAGIRSARLGGLILVAIAVIPLVTSLDLFSGSAGSSTSDIAWVELDEGIRLSNETGKKILVDVYTDWCTWCKEMDSDVYTSSAVLAEIEKHFIPVKLNAESNETVTFKGSSMTKIQFSQAVGVTGFPSTLFVDAAQEPITLVPGFVPAERFTVILRYIGEEHYKTTPFQSYLSQQPSSN